MKRTMDTASQTGKGARHAALFLGLAVAVGGCLDERPARSVPTVGKMCSTDAGDGLWGGSSEIPVDEGNGYVSAVMSSYTDMGSGSWSLNVTDCASGKGARLQTEFGPLNDLDKWYGPGAFEAKDDRFRGTPEEDVVALRKGGYLVDPERLRAIAPVAGYLPKVTQATAESEHTICACKLYYPKATGDWATTKMTDAAASN